MNEDALLNDTETLILLSLLLLFFVLLCLYYGLFLFRLSRQKKKQEVTVNKQNDDVLPSVSVLLIVHNDAYWLRDVLPMLLEQDYPKFEVVVVDYLSQDDTAFVVQVCRNTYDNIRMIPFREDANLFKGKKYPAAIGIQTCKSDIILLTEPHAVPKTFNWIRTVVAGYTKGVNIVSAYSGVQPGKGLLNLMAQYDNISAFASSAGMQSLGAAYTADGHNLSFRRDFFLERRESFANQYNIPEGMDDMFVSQNVTRHNMCVMMHSEAFVEQPSPANRHLFRQQRSSRYATKKYYTLGQKLRLAIQPVALFCFYVTVVLVLILHTAWWPVVVGCFVLKTAWQMVSQAQLDKAFGVTKVHWWAPLFEFYFLWANTISYLLSLRRKKDKWK